MPPLSLLRLLKSARPPRGLQIGAKPDPGACPTGMCQAGTREFRTLPNLRGATVGRFDACQTVPGCVMSRAQSNSIRQTLCCSTGGNFCRYAECPRTSPEPPCPRAPPKAKTARPAGLASSLNRLNSGRSASNSRDRDFFADKRPERLQQLAPPPRRWNAAPLMSPCRPRAC